MDVSETKRIIILGKTGAGKSSLANTIFGNNKFKIGYTLDSGTKKCHAGTTSVNGRSVTLIDTPGFFDTHRSEEDMKKEIVSCLVMCAPGPHAFLIVLRVERYTEQEQAVVNKIQECFSEDIFRYATVVFTHGDQLEEEETIKDLVQMNESLSDLMKKCGDRFHVADNKYWKDKPKDEYRSNQFQVEELLKTIDKMVMDNDGSFYTNEMLQVERTIQKDEGGFLKKLRIKLAGSNTDNRELCGEEGKKSGGQCHVVEDEYRSNQFQVKELLKTIDKMVMDNNGSCFTNEMLQQVEREIQQEEENIRSLSGNTSDKKNKEKGEVSFSKKPQIKPAGSDTKRIVILGKTGAGKSSLVNTIFGGKLNPKIGHSASSETSKCQTETRSVNGRSISLIDTPGFFDTDKSEEELRPEIVRCITECAPGPHAFLIVLKVERFTEHEQAVVDKIREYFSEAAFKYATVLFTHGDQLLEGQTIKDFVHGNNQKNNRLSDLVEKCGGRCHVIDNRYWKGNPKDEYRSNQVQGEELRKSLPTLEEEIRKKAKDREYEKLLIRLAGLGTGALLGAFLSVGRMVAAAVTALMKIAPLKPLAIKTVAGAGAAGGAAAAAGGAAAAAAATAAAGEAAGAAEGAAAAGGAAALGAAVVVGAVGEVVGGVAGYYAAGEAVKKAAKAGMGGAALALQEAQGFPAEVFQSESK